MSDDLKLQNVDGNLHYEGEPLMIFDPNERLNITFHADNREVGKLSCDPDGKMQFEGDLEESAERLFTMVKVLWDKKITDLELALSIAEDDAQHGDSL